MPHSLPSWQGTGNIPNYNACQQFKPFPSIFKSTLNKVTAGQFLLAAALIKLSSNYQTATFTAIIMFHVATLLVLPQTQHLGCHKLFQQTVSFYKNAEWWFNTLFVVHILISETHNVRGSESSKIYPAEVYVCIWRRSFRRSSLWTFLNVQ